MIGRESHPRRADRVVAQQVSGSAVLLNPDNGEYYSLDGVGERLWELCDGTRSVSDLVSLLCLEYEVSATTMEADLLELLKDLARERLVVGDR
jgi:hypothetical protein